MTAMEKDDVITTTKKKSARLSTARSMTSSRADSESTSSVCLLYELVVQRRNTQRNYSLSESAIRNAAVKYSGSARGGVLHCDYGDGHKSSSYDVLEIITKLIKFCSG